MIRKLVAKIGMKLCDFGLFVLNQGPLDEEDRQMQRDLIDAWKNFRKEAEL
jgi:hypothetical protein